MTSGHAARTNLACCKRGRLKATATRQVCSRLRMRRRRPEDAIQRSVFAHFAVRGTPGSFAFHPANGGWRSRVEAAILKGLGVRAGVPDVIAVKDGRTYALEL